MTAADRGQSYVERSPVAPLAGLVSAVWIQRVARDAEPYTQRNIPNGGVELLCPADAVPRVVGPLTRPLWEAIRRLLWLPGDVGSLTSALYVSDRSLRRRFQAAVGPRLNRQCLRLTGVSPRAFLDGAERQCACGHDHAASFAPVLRSRPDNSPLSRSAICEQLT